MLDEIYQWMRNILIFIIAVAVIFQLLGNSSYRKYAAFAAGMILMLFIVKPLLAVSGKDQGLWYLLDSYDYLFEAEDKSAELSGAQELRNSVIRKEYEDALAIQTNQLLNQKGLELVSMDPEFENDLSEASYGALKSLSVTAKYQKEANKNDVVSKVTVEQIVIRTGEKTKQKPAESDSSPLAVSAKNLLADFYNLDADHIHITIQEEGNG